MKSSGADNAVENIRGGRVALLLALVFTSVPLAVFTTMSLGTVLAVTLVPLVDLARGKSLLADTQRLLPALIASPFVFFVTWFLWRVAYRTWLARRGRPAGNIIAPTLLRPVAVALGILAMATAIFSWSRGVSAYFSLGYGLFFLASGVSHRMRIRRDT
jgi:hypothetical protein